MLNKHNSQRHSYNSIPAELTLDFPQVQAVIKSLRLYYLYQDNPPAHEIIIYPQSVQKDPDVPEQICATVKLIVDYCGEKIHKINVRFMVNKNFNCLPATLHYV